MRISSGRFSTKNRLRLATVTVTVTETRLEVAWLSIWLLHRIRTKQVKVTSIGNMGLVCIRKAITMVLSNNICKLPRSPAAHLCYPKGNLQDATSRQYVPSRVAFSRTGSYYHPPLEHILQANDYQIASSKRSHERNSNQLPFDLKTAIRVCSQAGYSERASYLVRSLRSMRII